jgi:CelD/BcsL family acetyltransferase involved in cellulose biosynthesis
MRFRNRAALRSETIAARPLAAQAASSLSVRAWSELEFTAGRVEWQALLARSAANPLFMSWAWQWRWWQLHRAALDAELNLLAAYAPDGRLVGLAPLFRHRARHRLGLRAERLEFLGSTFRGAGHTTFSEYLDFIVERGCETAVLAAFAARLREDRLWSDLVFANTPAAGLAARLAQSEFGAECYLRRQDALTAYVLPLPERFETYLAALKPGIRRKVWNRRARPNAPTFRWAEPAEIGGLLERIERFQAARWGARAAANLRPFHLGFAAAMAEEQALRLSVLCEDGEPISILYNIELDGTEYNLQSGFDPRVAALSPSYLHFGYCIEHAVGRGVRALDFLAGSGRSRAYKQDFGTEAVGLLTVQVIRAPGLARLYRLYDGVPQSVRACCRALGT